MLIEISNGFRAWGVVALLFALPAVWAFLRMAWRRAFASCEGVDGHLHCVVAFVKGLWSAGRDTNLQLNAWIPMAALFFAGGAGGAIFVSSNFLGGYGTTALNITMLPMWAMLAAAAWGVTIQTAQHKFLMGVSGGLMLTTTMFTALSLNGTA